jgi:hypothetical protein
MRKKGLVLAALGLSWGCHKPKKPPSPKVDLEISVSNECTDAVVMAFGADPESDDATMVEVDARETILWTLRGEEQLWSRDDDQAEWVAATIQDHEPRSIVSVCVTAGFALRS